MSSEVELAARPRPLFRNPMIWRAAAGVAILVGLVATQRIEGQALLATLRRVNPTLLLLSASGFLLLMAVKSWRWQFLVRAAGMDYGFWPAFRSYLAAFALGIWTPGRLGELARAAQLRAELGTDLAPCIRSVVADRLFDLIFLAALGPVALWAISARGMSTGFVIAAMALLYISGAIALWRAGGLVSRWQPRWKSIQGFIGCIGNVSADLVGRTGLVCSGVTWLSYGVYFGASFLLLRALDVRLSFLEVAYVTGCLSFILLMPISIAGIGSREATLVFLLGKYGVPREDALAYSILQFAVFTLFGGVIGCLALVSYRSAHGTEKFSAAPFAGTDPHRTIKQSSN